MKANELMFDDWVFCEGQPTPSNVRIKNIADDGVWFEGGKYEGAAFYDRIFPIPITPEILEKNGLRKLVTYGTEKWVCDNFRLNVYDSKKTWRFCAYTNRNEDTVVYIHFVHELQHALRLCGIEKEIEL